MFQKLFLTLSIHICLFNTNLISAAQHKLPMFSILNWNILGPNTRDANDFFPNKGYQRLNDIIDHIKTYNPKHGYASIVTLQEVDQNVQQILNNELSKLGYQEVAYQEKGRNGGAIIFAKKNEFNLIRSMNIALDGATIDPKYPGAAAVAVLESIKTTAPLIIASVHVSRANNASPTATAAGNEQILKLSNTIQQHFGPMPIIIAGDFNTHSAEIQSILIPKVLGSHYKDAFENTITSNSADGNTTGSIDHVLYAGLVQPTHLPVELGAPLKNIFIHKQIPSDHRSLYAVFFLPSLTSPAIPQQSTPKLQHPSISAQPKDETSLLEELDAEMKALDQNMIDISQKLPLALHDAVNLFRTQKQHLKDFILANGRAMDMFFLKLDDLRKKHAKSSRQKH